MKRLFGLGAVLVLVACGVGDAAVRPHASVTSIAAARERVALRAAGDLLRRIPLPPGAVRVAHPPANQYLRDSWTGTSVITMFADRHSFWRVRGSMSSVIRFATNHPAKGLTVAGGGGGASGQVESVQLYGHVFDRAQARTASVAAVNVDGKTYVRVDAAAAWIYPRSPQEAIPSGVREVDIDGGGVRRLITDAEDVARIVRWFGQLNVSPPADVICGPASPAHVTFVFRSASRVLARAVAPAGGGGNGCDPVSFTIGAKAQTPLVDTTPTPFAQRVERLLDTCFGAGPDRGRQPSPRCNKTWARAVATSLLRRLRLPPGTQPLAREPHGDGGLLRSPASVSGGAELVDQHHFWKVHARLASVEAFVQTHQRSARQTGSETAGGPGVPANHTITLTYFDVPRNGLISTRQIEVTLVALPDGWTGVRADAQVVWIYPRTQAQFAPANTQAIDVQAGSISRHITNHKTVQQITARFDRLKVVQPGNSYHCPAGQADAQSVEIIFHAITPAARTTRATAPSPGYSTPCSPIHYSGGHNTLLVGRDFVPWLDHLLRIHFHWAPSRQHSPSHARGRWFDPAALTIS